MFEIFSFVSVLQLALWDDLYSLSYVAVEQGPAGNDSVLPRENSSYVYLMYAVNCVDYFFLLQMEIKDFISPHTLKQNKTLNLNK